MTYQTQVPVANLPINLVLQSNGSIAFIKVAAFKALIDQAESAEGISAAFYEEDFIIGEDTFQWNMLYNFKEFDSMRKWLKQQKLSEPIIHYHQF